MERTEVLGRLNWQLGQVVSTRQETARTKSITLSLPEWKGHRAGQHLDVRLTAENGYQAERELILIACPRCTAKNMLHVEGQIEVTHVPPDPEAESTTDVAESIGRDVPKCWRCREKFYVFFRHLEGRKYAAEASLSQEFTREPENTVEAVDVRYDYGEKAWQQVIDGMIVGTIDLSGRIGEQNG